MTLVAVKDDKSKPIMRRLTLRMDGGKFSHTYVPVEHKIDPKKDLLDKVGEIENPEDFVQFTKILVAVYFPPVVTTTKGGILLPGQVSDEDVELNKNQSKVGLIIAMGSRCYEDDETTKFHGIKNNVGDWVWFRPTDGMPVEINGQICRVFREGDIIGRLPHPDKVW